MDLNDQDKEEKIIADICADENLKIVLQGDTSLVSEWDILYSNGSQLVRKDWSALQVFDWLDYEVQIHVALMSDPTLNSFIDDLEYNGSTLHPSNKKITALNGFDYNLARAFTAYKEGIQADLELTRDLISHNYKDGNQEVYNWADHWYKRSKQLCTLSNNRKNGQEFEKNITNALKSKSSLVYQRLKETVPDIDERQILSQVQFCINNSTSCSDSGQYFIADLALVKEGFNNKRQKIWDVIIADIKYKESSPFTNNQKKSTSSDIKLRVKSEQTKDINNKEIEGGFNNGLEVGKVFIVSGQENCHEYILKIYGDGLGIQATNFSSLYFQKFKYYE